MFERHDGVPVLSCGKMLDQSQVCNLVSIAGRLYLERQVAIAAQIFPAVAPTSSPSEVARALLSDLIRSAKPARSCGKRSDNCPAI